MKKHIKKRNVMLMAFGMLLLALAACAVDRPAEQQAEVPEDFSFSIVWGVREDHSYDSRTGRLVKDKHAEKPERYETVYQLTEQERATVYAWLQDLEPETLHECDRIGSAVSKPPITIALTLRRNGDETSITMIDIWELSRSEDPDVQKILSVCDQITALLAENEAWKALPDVETLYR